MPYKFCHIKFYTYLCPLKSKNKGQAVCSKKPQTMVSNANLRLIRQTAKPFRYFLVKNNIW